MNNMIHFLKNRIVNHYNHTTYYYYNSEVESYQDPVGILLADVLTLIMAVMIVKL